MCVCMCVCVSVFFLLQFVLLRIIQCQTSVAGIIIFHRILFSPAICPLESYLMLNISCNLQVSYSSAQFFCFVLPNAHSWELFNTKHQLEVLFSSNWDCCYSYFQTWLFASIPDAWSTFGLLVGSTFCCFAPLLTLQSSRVLRIHPSWSPPQSPISVLS